MKTLNRQDVLRGFALTGLAGVCTVLASREDKFECNTCAEFVDGQCRRGFQPRCARSADGFSTTTRLEAASTIKR